LVIFVGLKVNNLSGIYIHIPFCKQACHYCDFHFSTQTSRIQEMVDMICLEAELRKDYLLKGEPIKTVYFGGGTPSLLSADQLGQILDKISLHFSLDVKELTLEANPDDLDHFKLKNWKALGFDRLSIGIQTFDEKILKFYNRAHRADESLKAIGLAKQAGLQKLSIDLIYGFPAPNHELWKKDLEIALNQDPGHISSYCLTVEPKTALGKWANSGQFHPGSEDFAAEQFEILQEAMDKSNYLQYEISNFGREGAFAVHNTNYWRGVPYLGLGPSAHSFDGRNRGANISNNNLYIKQLKNGISTFKEDSLSPFDLANEYLLTSLRTMWGTDLSLLKKQYGFDLLSEKKEMVDQLEKEGLMKIEQQSLILTRKGKLLADGIAGSLFIS
jgi:oxygen-independent coproporphyrinogen III oxidase